MTQPWAPADRIRELNSINEDVSLMLQSAGQAVKTLTGQTSNDEMLDNTLESTKTNFETHVTEYYTKLQAIVARLRRQAFALEEAGIISVETATLTSTGTGKDARGTAEQGRITNAGMGNLDIGWLNSRGNQVAAEKELEIMNQLKELLQGELGKDKSAAMQGVE